MTLRPPAPAYVQFFPTLRCNLACGFCFNRELAPLPDVEPADFATMLDRLQAAGIGTLDLLGGEPTLHPRLDELVGAIAARGMHTTLSTNGRGDLSLLERLEDRFGRDTLRVGVSVNGGADAPRPLGEYIARRSPMLKSVCFRTWELPTVAAVHLARPDAEYHLIFRDPLAASDLDECISYPEYRSRLAALRSRHPQAAGVACDGFVPEGAAARLGSVRCPAGTTKLSVLPDGSVYPCYLLFSRPEFRIGNLLTDAFANIWDHPRLDFFRNFRGNTCPRAACEHHAACHGGCPAVSLLVAGDIEAPDPRCLPPTSCSDRNGRRPARTGR